MRKFDRSKTNELFVDFAVVLFIEWLERRGILSAFKENYRHSDFPGDNFEDTLRRRIRKIIVLGPFSLEDLIECSFVFSFTPEGSSFWQAHSSAWRLFCADFRDKF